MAIDWPNFMGLLNRHQCHGGAAHYGDGGLADCKAAGKRQNTTFVGWLYIGHNPPGLTAQNCLTAFGSFEARLRRLRVLDLLRPSARAAACK